MKKIRNIVVLGHLQSGKTTVSEALYACAYLKPKGNIEQGNTISDYTLEEKSRKSSVHSSIIPLEYKDTKINLIDCPGSDDFITDTISAISVVKGAILLIDAAKGIETQTKKLFAVCKMRGIPIFTFMNKLDREAKDPLELMGDLESVLGIPATAVTWPIQMYLLIQITNKHLQVLALDLELFTMILEVVLTVEYLLVRLLE